MTKTELRDQNTIFVLFGARGDLSKRMVVPALFNLFLDNELPDHFILLGIGHHDSGDSALADHFKQAMSQYSRRGAPNEEDWKRFASTIRFMQADLKNDSSFQGIAERIKLLEKDWPGKTQHIFYMATPPSLFSPIASGLGAAGLARDRERARIVVEKPLGHDLQSSREINLALEHYFDEKQIYRIDHFLGKETVQNILAMRFANPIFEPVWNRRYVDHVVITVAETLGVEQRAGYYDQAGALRDMVQNHLLQLLCLVAMEPPVAYDADDIRGKKVDILHALRPIKADDVSRFAARGQYGNGWVGSTEAIAYRNEPGINPRSNTETYAALQLYVDN